MKFDIVHLPLFGVDMMRLGIRSGCLVLAYLAMAMVPSMAMAQEPACPEGNLLADRQAIHWQDINGNLKAVTDGVAAVEGAQWNADTLTAILDSPAATITYDLGQVVTLRALNFQGDANDVIHLWGSLSPDQGTFKPIGQVEPVEGVHGLRTRQVELGGTALRYLRIGEGEGDNFYSVSELQAYCIVPTPWPPVVARKDAPVQEGGGSSRFWNDHTSRWWEMLLALMVAGLVYWDVRLKEEGKPRRYLRTRTLALFLALPLAVMTYLNFFSFHFDNFVHRWDTFHYYVGAKYFKELGFERMYECVAVADHESPDPALRRRVELRKITNLRTNALETTKEILKHPEVCKQHFTAERWDAFKVDIEYWRKPEAPKRWDDTSTDHGYNATPVWGILGTILSNTGPASDAQINWIVAIDPIYYVAMIVMVWWAFGWRVTAVAMTVFATNFGNRFYWTGGAFLRWDWLFYTTAVVCFLRKEKPFLAGLALGYATLLRVFPGFMAFGPLIALAVHMVRERRIIPKDLVGRKYVRLFVGAAVAFAVLIPVSFRTSDGIRSYQEFVKNSIKHKETPLTNYMGLRTVVAYRPSTVGRNMKDNRLADPWEPWKQARLTGYKQLRPVFYAVVLFWMVLMGFASLRHEPWVIAALGITFIPITTELTCYYYAFIIGVAVLYEKRPDVGWILCLLTAASEFYSVPEPLDKLGVFATWIDEQYTLISALTVFAFGVILWRFAPDFSTYLDRKGVGFGKAFKFVMAKLGVEPDPEPTVDESAKPAIADEAAKPSKKR
jgi:hypothetical protein